jgi:CheY-like chemotaxis protein
MARILLIDDDDLVRKMIYLTLEHLGHEVVEAHNGKEGIRLFDRDTTDLVITDLIMPEMEGIETILRLRKIKPGIPVVAMSGGGRIKASDLLPSAQQLGAKATLQKPFTKDELVAAIDAALGKAK